MTLARWQSTVTDAAGNIVPGALVEVRIEGVGTLVPLFSDRAGLTPKANPFPADGEGYAFFHAVGGAYNVRAYASGFERVWRYVAVGTNAESDFGLGNPRGAWVVDTEYFEGDLVSHVDGGDTNLFLSRTAENIGNEPDAATPGDTADWMFVGVAVQGPAGLGDRLDIPVFIQGRPRASELFPRIDMATDALIVSALCRATARVAANQERVFTVAVNGSPIMTITFASASATGIFAEVGSMAMDQFDIFTITAPPTQDATLADVSLTIVANRI